MTVNFESMKFEMETDRLLLSMWREIDASCYRKLVAERGEGRPVPNAARDKVISLRDSALENGITLLTIRRRDEEDYIGDYGLIIGCSTLEEPEIACELFRRVHGDCYAAEATFAVLDAPIATGRARIWATVRLWNDAAFRVFEKTGDHSMWDEEGELVWNVCDL